ncbi:MAG: hypothetical protein Wins2KO_14940 [Winogradskyella sp.]
MKAYSLNQLMFRMVVLTILLVSFLSCSNDDSDGNSSNINNYYFKYVIDAPGPYGRFSNWTARTPDGNYSNTGYQERDWTQTYGPVNKGFLCWVEIGDFQGGTPTIEIHVAKNDEPFVLKKTVTGANISYIID